MQPKAHPARQIPFEVREKLMEKLDEIMEKGIITKVEEPTRRDNSLVVEKRSTGDIGVCLDPINVNKAILREYHPIPVVDDIIPEMKD